MCSTRSSKKTVVPYYSAIILPNYSTDADGGYHFRTIRPVPYHGRTPHIHTAVFLPGERPFVPPIYIAGEPRNQEDFLYLSIPTEQRRLVEAEFRATSAGAEGSYRASLVIVLGGTPSQA
jgi:protocatechuate 3,4-dioxygenase beta subunit